MTLANQVLDLAIQIQQIPAPTFEEERRSAFFYNRFKAENLQNVNVDVFGNVYGCLVGTGCAKPVVVSAHIDTVFPMDMDLTIRRAGATLHGPGIGDNSLGAAGLLGLLWGLRNQQIRLPGAVWLVANVCEEGLGDLRGMRAVVEHFGEDPLAYIVLEGMALGQVYNRGLGVQRYQITISTGGGHSWVDYGRPSAIHELAKLITSLTNIKLPADPRTSLNVGMVKGGTSVNTIAAEASLELDLRSVASASLADLANRVENLVVESNCKDVTFNAEIIGQRPAGEIPADHPLVKLASDVLVKQGIQPKLNIGSTDANIPISLGLPCVCIGLTHGGGAHTVKEYIQISPINQGIAQLISLVTRSFEVLG